jgi:hypothetical protein
MKKTLADQSVKKLSPDKPAVFNGGAGGAGARLPDGACVDRVALLFTRTNGFPPCGMADSRESRKESVEVLVDSVERPSEN